MNRTHPNDALKIILAALKPLPVERAPLDQAAGRCLARDIRSDRDQPPTDRSAVDGYALRVEETGGRPQALRLAGESAAGSPCTCRVAPGTCVRVLTGAVMPRGANAVIMQEYTRQRDAHVRCLEAVAVGANIRRKGEEARKGAVVLEAGALLQGAQIGFCAAVGKTVVPVRPLPRVGVLSTGRELRTAGQRVLPHQIRDANGPAVCAALELAGFPAAFGAIVGDDPRRLAQAIRSAAKTCDVILLSGGVSVGRYDFVPEVIRSLHWRIRLHGLAMKPGKPLLYATLGRKHLFGLPGNPVSALLGLHLFAIPALRRLAGWNLPSCRPLLRVRLEKATRAKGSRVEFRLARLFATSEGWQARLLDAAGSADLAAACAADGVVALDSREGPRRTGQYVPFIAWRPIG